MTERRLGPATVRFTGRGDGDMRAVAAEQSWTWLRQVHGDEVVRVDSPAASAGTQADAAVTDQPGCALAVLTADCAPVALASPEGVIGIAHAGWRGLLAGVVARTVKEMHALGASEIIALLGPCIRAECYEFGPNDLAAVADRFGAGVATTVAASGKPALDLPAAVRAALDEVGVHEVDDLGVCTACSPGYFSWRAAGDHQRQATVIWR